MRRTMTWTVALAALAFTGRTQEPKPQHVLLTGEPVWGQASPALPKGAMLAVVAGDPGKPGPFTLRLKVPAGYKIAPHWHPTDENVTVISGTVSFGMGDTFVAAEMKEMSAGGYAMMPATMRHYFVSKTAAVIQVHGTGPFTLNYVNPADDPRQASTK